MIRFRLKKKIRKILSIFSQMRTQINDEFEGFLLTRRRIHIWVTRVLEFRGGFFELRVDLTYIDPEVLFLRNFDLQVDLIYIFLVVGCPDPNHMWFDPAGSGFDPSN